MIIPFTIFILCGTANVLAECPGLGPEFQDISEIDDPTFNLVIDGISRNLVGNNTLRSILITNNGVLVIKDGVDAYIRVQTILSERDGQFLVGDEDCPHMNILDITLVGRMDDGEAGLPAFGKKVIATAPTGTTHINGPYKKSWTLLDGTLFQDSATEHVITLADDVSTWKTNDVIVISSTDRDMNQAEEFTIVDCPACTDYQVMIKGAPQYTHWGEITDGIDMRAEVGVLTRTIKIHGEMEDSCYGDNTLCQFFNYDTFGGQTQVLVGYTSAHYEGIELYNMGQQGLGNYPIHFHRTQQAVDNNAYARQLSIHDCFSRCVTLHACQGVSVEDNVGYNTLGHCYFLEDGNEYNNTIRNNLGLVTKAGSLLPADRDDVMCREILSAVYPPYVPLPERDCRGVATFWIAHPENVVEGNVAGGSEQMGFFFVFYREPTGPSIGTLPEFHGERSIQTLFENNKAHSNPNAGFFMDRGVKTSDASAEEPREFLALSDYARYMPHLDRDPLLPRVPAIIKNYTAYKNGRGFFARGGDIYIQNSIFGDNDVGVTFNSLGELPYDAGSHQEVTDTSFYGYTANVGTDPVNTWYPQRAIEIHDGPISVRDCSFYRYPAESRGRQASAVAFFPNNTGQNTPANSFSGSLFDGETLRAWFGAAGGVYNTYEGDGDNTQIFYDTDGSLSGTGVPTYVVRMDQDILSQGCLNVAPWNASVCQDIEFGQIYLTANTKTLQMTIQKRDGSTVNPLVMRGSNHLNTLSYPDTTNYQPVLRSTYNYNLGWDGVAPDSISVSNYNFQLDGWVGLGLCYPSLTTFNLTYARWEQMTDQFTYSEPLTEGNSVQDVTADPSGLTYYWDETARLLYIKSVKTALSHGFNYCPDIGCEFIFIDATIIRAETSTCN